MEKKLDVLFGENVFNEAVQKRMLPEDVYRELKRVQNGEEELSLKTADIVADAMKEWALSKGATHYCHWFQPLTGITAEKHEAFLKRSNREGKALLGFSGKALVRGESDASSFPSGGLRATFEARGYTTWDTTSPVFVREDASGMTLFIPTALFSYGGEALDKKTPLLRSVQALNDQALRLIRLFGNSTSKKIIPCVGAEQEYFIIDREKYLKREDLMFAGRTLFGAHPPKGQEMGDHYMGTIPERVGAYMRDVDEVLWKLGVPAKTQHNEVAPGQHELATVYEECNIATDHNQLVMESLKRTAKRLGLACLLIEKPYAGVNGSGKHNNWSLMTDDGIQFLNPGSEPHKNTLFLLTLACVIRAVDMHSDLLAESVMSASNENRLGGNEAPPSIISMFLGTQLTDLLRQILETGDAKTSRNAELFRTDVSSLANFDKDVTDRNRTSPFAFTGNKFEFRAVGSKDSLAKPNTVLNTIVTEAFKEAGDRLEALLPGENASAEACEKAARQVAAEFISEHARIVFNGDNYSEDWKAEAARRGLPILHGVVEATDCLLHEDAIGMFDALGVYSRRETESRVEIKYETYAKSIRLEAVTMIDMAERYYIPAVIRFEGKIAKSLNEVKAAVPGVDTAVQEKLVERISEKLSEAYSAMTALREAAAAWKEFDNERDRAVFSRDTLKSAMAALRAPIDKLERMVSRADWPVPTYAELMDEN
ncbi:MAG: glutamine synthetase III [Lachnospiraceae bacterium]|nr:glutamine synthetase III [Lachnospiraceae bacterium]